MYFIKRKINNPKIIKDKNVKPTGSKFNNNRFKWKVKTISYITNNIYKRNLTETSEELISLLMNNPEINELDLSENCLSKLPIEIQFLPCLSVLDIRNNNFQNVNYTKITLNIV